MHYEDTIEIHFLQYMRSKHILQIYEINSIRNEYTYKEYCLLRYDAMQFGRS
jgi:hypothetical protein